MLPLSLARIWPNKYHDLLRPDRKLCIVGAESEPMFRVHAERLSLNKILQLDFAKAATASAGTTSPPGQPRPAGHLFGPNFNAKTLIAAAHFRHLLIFLLHFL